MNTSIWTDDGDLTAVPARVAANDNQPRLIALTGAAGSGKSTVSNYLVERHGYRIVKFAGPLKDMMRAIGLTENAIEGDLKESALAILGGQTPRYAMQTLGTEWGRKCMGDDFWVNLWRSRALALLADGKPVVVDDCRFPNEAAAVRRLGGRVVKLEGRGGIAGSHESESGCGIVDAVLLNDGDRRDLYRAVDRWRLAA